MFEKIKKAIKKVTTIRVYDKDREFLDAVGWTVQEVWDWAIIEFKNRLKTGKARKGNLYKGEDK